MSRNTLTAACPECGEPDLRATIDQFEDSAVVTCPNCRKRIVLEAEIVTHAHVDTDEGV